MARGLRSRAPRTVPFREIGADGKPGPYRGWNGVGLPPEWAEWGLLSRVAFIVVSALGISAVYTFMHWFVAAIGLTAHS